MQRPEHTGAPLIAVVRAIARDVARDNAVGGQFFPCADHARLMREIRLAGGQLLHRNERVPKPRERRKLLQDGARGVGMIAQHEKGRQYRRIRLAHAGQRRGVRPLTRLARRHFIPESDERGVGLAGAQRFKQIHGRPPPPQRPLGSGQARVPQRRIGRGFFLEQQRRLGEHWPRLFLRHGRPFGIEPQYGALYAALYDRGVDRGVGRGVKVQRLEHGVQRVAMLRRARPAGRDLAQSVQNALGRSFLLRVHQIGEAIQPVGLLDQIERQRRTHRPRALHAVERRGQTSLSRLQPHSALDRRTGRQQRRQRQRVLVNGTPQRLQPPRLFGRFTRRIFAVAALMEKGQRQMRP